jgi:superfamily II DNA/RNA helicase
LIGGSNKAVDFKNFSEKGGNIVIASPGKLKEILETHEYTESFHFRHLEVLILGFIE